MEDYILLHKRCDNANVSNHTLHPITLSPFVVKPSLPQVLNLGKIIDKTLDQLTPYKISSALSNSLRNTAGIETN